MDEKQVTPEKSALPALISMLKARIVKNFIIFALSVAVIVAFSYPFPGKEASKIVSNEIKVIEFINNVLVFLISGLTLRIEDMKSVYKYKFAVLYGLACINVLTTFIAFATIRFPFPTQRYAVGLTIFCSVPTTLGVGVALTTEAKGDKVMSLFMTVVSNMLGIITIPYLLQLYLSSGPGDTSDSGHVSIDPAKLAYRLTLTVLIPTIFGIGGRRFIPGLAAIVDKYKVELGMFSMTNLMMIVWMSLSGARELIFKQDPVEILVVFFTAIVLHLFYLFVNYLVMIKGFGTCVPLKQAVSVIIMSSQKSSPVALSVIAVVASSASEKGLLTIPCILGQVGQIFVGSFLTGYFASWIVTDEASKLNAADDKDDDGNLNVGDKPNNNFEPIGNASTSDFEGIELYQIVQQDAEESKV